MSLEISRRKTNEEKLAESWLPVFQSEKIIHARYQLRHFTYN